MREVLVDVNDRVQRGQVLVVLDTAKLQDQVNSARAALASAQAQVVQADASAREAQAQLARLEELARLSGGKMPSVAELDAARAALERAQAAQATARAAVEQARAALSTNETNLAKASIRSPIDGVVLARNTNVGDVAGDNALIEIADLSEVWVELRALGADAETLQVGQEVEIASATGESKTGGKIQALLPMASGQSVVARTSVDNFDGRWRPGMTVAAEVIVNARQVPLAVKES
ncbi:efflux RND transporter periplasmic adaptor subunit, partial [Cutibacterium acnes]